MGIKKKRGGVVRKKRCTPKEPDISGPAPRFTAKRLGSALSKFCATRPDHKLYIGGDPENGYLVAHGHAAVLLRLGGDFEDVEEFKVPRTKAVVELDGSEKFSPVRALYMNDGLTEDSEAERVVAFAIREFFEPAKRYKKVVSLVRAQGGFACVLMSLMSEPNGKLSRLCYAVTADGWSHVGLFQTKYVDAVLALAGKNVTSDGWRIVTDWKDFLYIDGKKKLSGSRSMGVLLQASEGDLCVEGYLSPFQAGANLADELEALK